MTVNILVSVELNESDPSAPESRDRLLGEE